MTLEATTMRTGTMGKVIVQITHITWRDGRPRFIPGTNLRAMGYSGRDLKHPDGSYYSLSECREWSGDLCRQLADIRENQQQSTTSRPQLPGSSKAFDTLGQVYDKWIRSSRFSRGTTKTGRKSRKPLSRKSITFYKKMMHHIERDHVTLWNTPAAAIKTHHLESFYDRLDEDHGVSVSCGVMKTLSSMFNFARKHNIVSDNPVHGVAITAPEPNLRAGTIEEMQHLITTADNIDLPQIGDSILLGLMTGQRQADRLNLVEAGRNNGRIFFKQQKTGALVDIPELPQLATRLKANYARRAGNKINWPGIIIHEATQRVYKVPRYTADFRKVVATAAKTMPSLADFRDKHLRKTCVTWQANAGCTNLEIAQVTGHSLVSISNILKHYAAPDPERADNAMDKLGNWLEKKGADL